MATPHEEFRKAVVELATLNKWRCYWVWKSHHSPAGFQDLVLARPTQGQLCFAELKVRRDIIRPEQQEWHDTIKAIEEHPSPRVYARIWRRGEDWDQIKEILA